MKHFRCPWCGKAVFTMASRLRMGSVNDGYRYRRRNSDPECENCGRRVALGQNLVTSLLYFLPFTFLLISYLIFCVWLKIYTLFIAILFLDILICVGYIVIFLCVTPPLARRDDKGDWVNPPMQFEIEVAPPISLRIEQIYAIRLKDVAAEDVNVEYDKVIRYRQDGAPVHILQGDFALEMGILEPEYYNLEYFRLGSQFDVIDADGNKISTGIITRMIEPEE